MKIIQFLKAREQHITETLLTAFVATGVTHYLTPPDFNLFLLLPYPYNQIPDSAYWVIFYIALFWLLLPKRYQAGDLNQESLLDFYEPEMTQGMTVIKKFGVNWKIYKGSHSATNHHQFSHVEGPYCPVTDCLLDELTKPAVIGKKKKHYWYCEKNNKMYKRTHYPDEEKIIEESIS